MMNSISSHTFSILFLVLFLCHSCCNAISDLDVLLRLKEYLTSPNATNPLQDWKPPSIPTVANPHCRFSGISCNAAFRVVKLNVSNVPLFGTVPVEIGMLDALQSLTLAGDSLTGSIPPTLANLTALRLLNISNNSFSGSLPASVFSRMLDLQVVDAYNNNLTGPLPVDVVGLKKLRILRLGGNYFTGEIPENYSEIQSLERLELNTNSLTGRIPASLSRLQRLKFLFIGYYNNFTGGIPDEFGNFTELIRLGMESCNLTGTIPPSLGKLKKLDTLFLQENSLTGAIPPEIGEMWSLMSLDLAFNLLTGKIPENFHKLHTLTLLNLFHNSLVGQIPPFIGHLPNLEVLQVWGNNFTIDLPDSLGSNGRLKILDVTSNHLTGTIPRDLCKGDRLEFLILMDNSFVGLIPDEIGACKTLKRVRIGNNYLQGSIPVGLFSMPRLELLELNDNLFTGALPVAMSGDKLSSIDLSNNRMTGGIPSGIRNFIFLEKISLQHNRLTGEIPSELFTLKQLSDIDLSGNTLTGDVPASIGDCSSLISIDFSQNQISGVIPSSIANLPVLSVLNLSRNSFTGEIPKNITAIHSLTVLDLSNNNLCGKVHTGGQLSIFNATPCHNPSRRDSVWWWCAPTRIIILISFITLILISILTQEIRRRKNLELSRTWKLTAFHHLDFKAEDVLDCIREENVIGKGGAGIVYRGTMLSGMDIAIKRLVNRGAGFMHHDHGFSAEIQTLGRIRHRHIVRLLGHMSNKDTNLLLYEYMSNGSLGEMLHGSKGVHLQWNDRYKIAVEAAKGLSYLHHDSSPLILHRDVKSNNILLDSENEAHVADFGLAKFLLDSDTSECMSSIAGSYGYIAPEYAYTLKVDEKSDVYSFGVVLLELITGRRPLGEFGDGVDIVRWVQKTMSEISHPSDATYVLAILDSRLSDYSLSSVVNMFKIAMLCVQNESRDRPTMREVVHMLTNPPMFIEPDKKLLSL
ncbi:hypothetical protein V2J09_018089 [Rumex salicifolius]